MTTAANFPELHLRSKGVCANVHKWQCNACASTHARVYAGFRKLNLRSLRSFEDRSEYNFRPISNPYWQIKDIKGNQRPKTLCRMQSGSRWVQAWCSWCEYRTKQGDGRRLLLLFTAGVCLASCATLTPLCSNFLSWTFSCRRCSRLQISYFQRASTKH